jgi:glycosyltransferase involved in cell wall biosynthesis
MRNKPPKICFVEALAYPVLSGDKRQSSTGGESVQHTLLARAFAELGWQVSMISRDVGQEDGTVVDGVQVWKTYVQKAGLPYIRFVHPRLTSIWRALKQADADIYFQSCAGLMTGAVARFAASRGRQMIFRAAHDTDFMPGEELINYDRDRHFYRYGLKRAGLISVQSEVQQQLLSDNYGLPSVVVDMAAEIPSSVPDEARDIDVLWVNNYRQFKRPEIVLDIARAMPDTSFFMIGGQMQTDRDLYFQMEAEAQKVENLNFVGPVPYSDVNSYFFRAKVFLNTSDSEGFPNSFLQAWVRCVPVVSYFDPDGYIAGRGLGASPDTQDDFVPALSAFLENEAHRQEVGARARQFVIDSYSSAVIAKQYEQLIKERFDIENR